MLIGMVVIERFDGTHIYFFQDSSEDGLVRVNHAISFQSNYQSFQVHLLYSADSRITAGNIACRQELFFTLIPTHKMSKAARIKNTGDLDQTELIV